MTTRQNAQALAVLCAAAAAFANASAATAFASASTAPCPHPCKCSVVAADNGARAADCTDFPATNLTIAWHVLNVSLDSRRPASPVLPPFDNFTRLAGLHITGAGPIPFLNASSFEKLSQLNELSLVKNGLKNIHPDVFAKHWDLRRLSLRNNPGLAVAASFVASKSIVELDLSECSLKTLKREYFDGLPRLEVLKAERNDIALVGPTFVPSSLKVLDLADNRIVNVYGVYDDYEVYRHFDRVDLTGNPINCTCKLWEIGTKLSHEKVIFEQTITCKNTGQSLKSMMWCI